MAGQIFSGNINALATSWMMIYMLMFAVAWEAWTGFLERRAEDNKAQMEMLSKAGRELIILGFIAFGVILLKELNVFHWNSATLLCFEAYKTLHTTPSKSIPPPCRRTAVCLS